MEDKEFEKIEKILYRYWKKKEKIERLRKSLATVEGQIKDIRELLVDKDDLRPSLGIIGNYMFVISGHGVHGDPVNQNYESYTKTIENLEENLRQLRVRKISIKQRLMRLEFEIDGVEFAVSHLSDLDRQIIEQRYQFKRSNLQIGIALGYDEKSIRNKRRKLMAEVARLLAV